MRLPSFRGMSHDGRTRLTQHKKIGLGLCNGLAVNFHGMPGWYRGMWGYHGDDGILFLERGFGPNYSETYGVGDVVGCGVDKEQNLFFTKNGVHLGRLPPRHFFFYLRPNC